MSSIFERKPHFWRICSKWSCSSNHEDCSVVFGSLFLHWDPVCPAATGVAALRTTSQSFICALRRTVFTSAVNTVYNSFLKSVAGASYILAHQTNPAIPPWKVQPTTLKLETVERAPEGSVLAYGHSDWAGDADRFSVSGTASWLRGKLGWYPITASRKKSQRSSAVAKLSWLLHSLEAVKS